MPLIHWDQASAGRRAGSFVGDTPWSIRVRFSLFAMSLVLGFYALWQLAAEFIHPVTPYFVSEPAPDQADRAPAAALAAQVAMFRGDFWFDDALLTWLGASGSTGSALLPALDDARLAATRSARLAPHDARAWLLLALIDARAALDPRQQAEALKMSYYTGPNDLALIPSRMKMAVQSPAIADPDFQSLVLGEVLSVVRQPALQSAIVSSYRQASPDGKRFLESAVGRLDPALVSKMQAPESDPLRF